MVTRILSKKFEAKNGVLITGLPGIGLVGHVCVNYMKKKLNAKKVAIIYSDHFPHQVLMKKDGRMRMLRNVMYLIEKKEGIKRPILLLTGDVQAGTSEGQYEVAEKIINFAKKRGINEVITIGGYSTGVFKEDKKVFGAVNNKRYKEQWKGVVFGEAKGSIVGAAGLIPAIAKYKGIKGICLMGETQGSYVDSASAKKVLEILLNYLNISLDLSELEKEAMEKEKVIKKIEEEIKKKIKGEDDTSYIR